MQNNIYLDSILFVKYLKKIFFFCLIFQKIINYFIMWIRFVLIFLSLLLNISALTTPLQNFLPSGFNFQFNLNKKCSKGFLVSADFQLAICSNFRTIRVFKWNQSLKKFQLSQTLQLTDIYQVYLSDDSLMLTLTRQTGLFEIYTRPSHGHFQRLYQRNGIGWYGNFLTKNRQHLFISGNKTQYHQLDTLSYIPNVPAYTFDCIFCEAKISENGKIFVVANKSLITIYARNIKNQIQLEYSLNCSYVRRTLSINYIEKFIVITFVSDIGYQILKYNLDSHALSFSQTFILRTPSLNYRTFANHAAIEPNNRFIFWFSWKLFFKNNFSNTLQNLVADRQKTDDWQLIQQGIYDISFQQLNNRTVLLIVSSWRNVYIYSIGSQYCSSLQHTTGQMINGVCACEQGYKWNSQRLECLNCTQDVSSTGILLQNGQCQCLPQHFWDAETQECMPHCNTGFAIDRDLQYPKKCFCRNGAQWNQKTRQCYLNCPNVAHSTGQLESSQVCQCLPGSNWNPDTFTCDLHCQTIPHSTGYLDESGQACICISGHAWLSLKGICLRECPTDSFHTGYIQENGICHCAEGAKWNFYSERCEELDCGEIGYTRGKAQDGLACICQDEFSWNASLHLCVLNCHNISDSLSLNSNLNAYTCECKQEAVWDEISRRCIRNCKLVSNSTGININANVCQCQSKSIWDENLNLCQPTCGHYIGETGLFHAINGHCECKPQFFWQHYYKQCFLNCSLYPHTKEGSSFFQYCQCQNFQYYWNSLSYKCELGCYGFWDLSADSSGQKCICQENSVWDSTSNKCVLQCNKDPLSNGIAESYSCSCKINAFWSIITNKCQCQDCYEFDEESSTCKVKSSLQAQVIGPMGGAIALSAFFFIGIYFYHKKKKVTENQEAVKVDEIKEVIESVQELENQEI